jgi:NarL family two-component system response regulator YdfI
VIRVLIVAAYASVRAGLHSLLADADGCVVVGAVSGSEELERILLDAPPEVVLFDDNEGDGERVFEVLSGSGVGLVLLGDQRSGYQRLSGRALAGWAYLLKEAEGVEIAGALQAAAAGLVALDRSLAPLIAATAPLASEGPFPAVLAAGEALTPREREILQLMAEGLQNKQIARRLSISQHTVKFHVASVLARLGAASRTEAVTMGARRGYVTL